MFVANAVRPIGAQGVDVTVIVKTGGVGLGTGWGLSNQWTAPMWRVDDEPVMGLSWDLCRGASEASLRDVAEGLPAPWPRGLGCANVTYKGPDSTYSHTVPLSEGVHMLWVGVVQMNGQRSRGWLGGSIEVANTLGPLFPDPYDK